MRDGEFRHRRLVAVYDLECPWGPEDDVFTAIAGRTPAGDVLDLGCGTGRLAVALAAAGHRVTGVDPAAASLEAARAKPGASQVTWVEGTLASTLASTSASASVSASTSASARLPTAGFDVALMTSHVAQAIVDEDEWSGTLDGLRRVLRPGATLAFDTRDPDARAWERWTPDRSARSVALPGGGTVQIRTEVDSVDDTAGGAGGAGGGAVVTFTHHYAFPDGEELDSTSTLRFRPEAEVRRTLVAAGFVVESIHGGWNGEPVGEGPGELLVVAVAGGLGDG